MAAQLADEYKPVRPFVIGSTEGNERGAASHGRSANEHKSVPP